MEQERKPLKAVHERDLDALLLKIGKKDDLDNGLIKCKFCSTVITSENLHSVLPEAGAFNFVCENSECVRELLSYLDEKNIKQIDDSHE